MTQKQALKLLKNGHNVFLTGAAGSGKTHVLQQYINYLRQNDREVAITASTGIAATHLEGVTIHSWSGIGIKDQLTEVDRLSLMKKPYLKYRFIDVEVLIIDEVSMLDGKRLDLINEVCQMFRQSIQPFGGMQVVLCGDLFQLPPITKKGERPDFVFRSDSWKQMDLTVCYLQEQYRQDDKEFLSLLNQLRSNTLSQKIVDQLHARKMLPEHADHLMTRLFTHNANVDQVNLDQLDQLEAKGKTYHLTAEGEDKVVEKAIKGCLAPEDLELKEGAVVMFVKNNFTKGYVNGTMGTVVGFSEDGYPLVKTRSGKKIEATPEAWTIKEGGEVLSHLEQVPLRLAWAITIHKSQGMTLDAAQMDLSRCFEPGMGYVALSRLKTLEGLYLTGLNEMALQVNTEILEYDSVLQEASLRNE